MAERSLMWATGLYGDGLEAYEQADIAEMLRVLFTSDDHASRGVFPGYLNALEVTGTSSPVSVNTGAAMVNGLFYHNDEAVEVAIATPVSGTTGHRIVLRATYGTTQTVRITDIASADGTATIPAMTQTDGITWDIPLATLTITTGGVISVTDARVRIIPPTTFGADNAGDAVDDTIVGNRVPALTDRKGGSATEWATAGNTGYTPTMVRMQCGAVVRTSGDSSGNEVITFPTAFAYSPVCFVGMSTQLLELGTYFTGVSYVATATTLTIYWHENYTGISTPKTMWWLAIGPE